MAAGGACGAIDPGAVRLSAAVLHLGSVRQLRLHGSRSRLCGPA